MKKKWTYIAVSSVIGIAVFVGSTLSLTSGAASSGQAGNANDPLVTKSYVDQQIKNSGGGGTATVTNVSLTAGQTLIGNAGTEFIVRTGSTKAYSKDGSGIPDLTDGKDLADGVAVSKNHLLMFPRDGRGVTSITNSIVMVRGGYTILSP